MKLRLSKLPTGLGWSAWLLIAPLAGWAPPSVWAAEGAAAVPIDGYTVNFKNVSVQEFIRFIAKATGQNFVYDQDFTDFQVTVISEEPTSAQNLITILMQVLRTQGYSLLEQGDNLLVHKSADVSQVAQVVTEDTNLSSPEQGALVTGVFRLKQTSPDALLPILQPMVSKTARIDASKETNQIIVTDVSQNVQKIEQLLRALDAPNPLVTVSTFDTTSAFSQETVDTAQKILDKVIGTSPFFMSAQPDSQQVFIVASPFLVQQAKEVLAAVEKGQLTEQNGQPYFFSAQTQSAETLLVSLQEMADGLKKNGVKRSDLIQAIETAQVIPSSNSLLFLADATSQKKLDDFLKQMDTPKEAKAGVNTLLFRPTQLTLDQLGSYLKEIVAGLKASGLDADLMRVLETSHPLTGQGYLFSGSSATLDKVNELLKKLDSAGGGAGQATLVPLKNIGPNQAQSGLTMIANSLKKEGVSDEALFRAIESIQGVNGSNLLILSGTGSAVTKIQDYLKSLDTPIPAGALAGDLVSIPLKGNGQEFLDTLRRQASHLDPAIAQLIASASFVPESNSMWVRGEKTLIGQLQDLIDTLQGTAVLVYKPKNTSLTGLQTGLLQFADQLEGADYPNKPLIQSLRNLRLVPASNSLLFSGPQPILDEINSWLTSTLDTANPGQAATQYVMIRPSTEPADRLLARLRELSRELGASGLTDSGLLAALNSAQIADNGQMLVLAADKETIARVQDLLKQVEDGVGAPEVYQAKHLPATLLKQDLISFLTEMGMTRGPYAGLRKVAENVTVMPDGNSLAYSGSAAESKQMKILLEQLDQAPTTGAKFALFPIPASVDPQSLLQTIQKLASSSGGDRLLQETLRTAQYIPQSHAISLNGPDETVKMAQDLLSKAVAQVAGTQTLTYYPKVVSATQLAKELQETAASMQQAGANYALVKALQSAHLGATGKGLILQVDSAETEEVNKVLAHLDSATGSAQLKLVPIPEGVSPENYLKAIDDLNMRLRKAGSIDRELEAALNSRELVGDSRTVSFTGSSAALAQVEQYLGQLSYRSEGAGQASVVFVYQIKEAAPAALQASLNQIAADLSASQNSQDQQVARVLRGAKHLDNNRSLLFSGPPGAIGVVQQLVPSLDTGTALPGGKPQLFFYRVQGTTVDAVETGLNALLTHLDPANPADVALTAAIKSMKALPDQKTLLFTVDPATLDRLQQQLAALDGGGGQMAQGASKFLIYPLQAASASRVEADLKALAASLQKSGLDDPSLFRSIANMQVDLKANSVIFSGSEDEFAQLKPLIAIYDQQGESGPDGPQALIEPIANSAFMVYPLQFMLGNEIESTLRQMGKDLQNVKSNLNENLLHAISTMQWIQASNTLCFSGDAATLEKLRVLIANLDQPLRQVFVEVLVIRTSLSDSYTFGLDWAGQGQIDPNYGIGFGNTQLNSTPAANLLQQVGGLTKTQPVAPPSMGSSAGNVVQPGNFSLSAIGNVVRHNGQTFFDLGSLVNALQQTSVGTVVINPKIIAQDSNTATIYSGKTYGFITQQTSVFSTSTANATTIDYRSVGVNLNITPIITGETVTLDIDQVYSDIVDGFQPSAPTTGTSAVSAGTVPVGAGAFPVNNVHLTTRAHVPDQAILCISGVVLNSKTQGTTQIPCLGGLPLIGALFTTEQETEQKDTLLIFIKPYILQSLDEMRAITQANAKMLRQSTDCYGVEDVQAGLDSIGYDKVPKTRSSEVPCIIE